MDKNKATWELDEGGAGGEEGGEEGGGDSQHTGHTSKLGTSGQGKKRRREGQMFLEFSFLTTKIENIDKDKSGEHISQGFGQGQFW